MLGSAAVEADGAGYKHTFVMDDPLGLGLTVQVGRPSTDGTVNPFTYTGCKVVSWEMSNAVDDLLMARLTLDGQNETTATALASASYPSNTELFYFTQGEITLGGSEYPVSNWSVNYSAGVKTDRFFVNRDNRKREQVLNAFAELGGSLTTEFDDLTSYNRFVNGTLASLVLEYETATTYDTSKPYRCRITLPSIRFDGETPSIGGPDIVEQSLNFKALNNGVDEPITIEYFTTDTTA